MSSGKEEKLVGISTKVSVEAATTGEGLASAVAEDRSPAATAKDVSQVEGMMAGLSTNPKRKRRHKMSGAQERKLRRERARLRASEAGEGGTSQTGPLPKVSELTVQRGPPPKANDPSKRGTLPKEGDPSRMGTLPKANDQPLGSQSNVRGPKTKSEAVIKKKKRFSWTPLEKTLIEKGRDTAIPGSSGITNTGLRPSIMTVKSVVGTPNPPKVDQPLMKAPKLKRGRSDEDATPTSKRKREASTPKSYAQVAREKTDDTFIKVAVVDSGAPGGKLTEERQVLLQNALDAAFDAAIDASAEGLPVRFAWSGFRRGFFRATCMDRFTVDFLKEQIAGIGKLWDDCNLQVVGKNDIPRLFKVSVTVRGKPRPTADILSCLKKQNGLKTELWEVHHRKEEEDSVFLVFGVDQDSFKWLNEKDGLVPFRLTSLKFRPGCRPPSERTTNKEADPTRPTSEKGQTTAGAEIIQSSSGEAASMLAYSTLRAPGRDVTPTPISSEEERAILGDLSSDEESTMTEEMEEEAMC